MKASLLYRLFFVFAIAAALVWGAMTSVRAAGTTYYVATTGSDSNAGTSALPFLTIQKATSIVNPGDTVIIRSGTYNVSTDISITRSGSSAGGYIVFKSEVPLGAKIVGSSSLYNIIDISGSYIELNGLDVSGNVGGHCVESHDTHHTRIIGNALHNCGGSGFQGNYGDYYYVEGNTIYGNSNTNGYATSGISLYQARAISDNLAGFHIVVRNNITYNNIETTSGTHTDGNGIIIDDFHNGQNGSTAGNYPYQTLVENNLSYYNGGKGIQVYVSDHVTVRNNTVYWNNRDTQNTGTWRGELNLQEASDVKFINNIAWTNTSYNSNNTAILEDGGGTGNSWYNNISYNGTVGNTSVHGTIAGTGNKLGVNPLFVAAGTTGTANFRLQASSPAINAGTSAYGLPTLDLDGNARVSGTAVDMGAYEYGGAAPTATVVGPTATSAPSTATVVGPTATRTRTAIAPTATRTSTAVAPTATSTGGSTTLTIQAEAYSSKAAGVSVFGTGDPLGGVNEIGGMDNGNWVAYNNVNFGTGILTVRARGATTVTSGQLNFRTGSKTGPIFCTINMSSTGGWSTYGTLSANCPSSPTGTQTLYVTVQNFYGFNINWFELVK